MVLKKAKTLEECAALCRGFQLDFIELNMNLPEYQIDNIDVDYFNEIADKYGIYYTIHLDENLNPCDFNERVSTAYTETMLQTIETAKQLKVPILNMHLSKGVYFTLPDKKVFLFDEYEAMYLKKMADFRDKCEIASKGTDIKICVENTRSFQQSFAKAGISTLLKSSVFAITFDTGHDAVNGFAQQPLILQNIDRLSHMHIHDAKDKNDHLPLGEGALDLPKYFHLAGKQNCRVVLEIKTVAGLKKSVEWLKSKGGKL